MHIKKRYISNVFLAVTAKQKLSGNVSSPSSGLSTIFILDRNTMNLIATTIADPQTGDWVCYVPFRNDEQLIAICRDESGDFNADIYDRISLCTNDYVHVVEFNSIVIPGEDLFFMLESPKQTGAVAGFPHEVQHRDLKSTISTIGCGNNLNESIFKNISEVQLSIGEGGDIPEVVPGSLINGNSGIWPELTTDDRENRGVKTPDIFGDSSCRLCLDFKDGLLIDKTGTQIVEYAKSQFRAAPGKYNSGFGNANLSFHNIFDLGINFISGEANALSFWVNINELEYTGADTYIVHHSSDYGFRLGFRPSTRTIYLSVGSDTSWSINNQYITLPVYPYVYFAYNSWVHFVVSIGVSSSKIYVDGQLVKTFTGNGFTASTGTLIFNSELTNRGTKSTFDIIRVFNREITDGEAIQLFEEKKMSTVSVTGIYGVNPAITDKLILNGLSSPPICNFRLDGHFADVSDSNFSGYLDGVFFNNDFINFDGTNGIHSSELSTDIGTGSVGDEGAIDLLCKFSLEDITNIGTSCLYKSGDNSNGIALGFNAVGDLCIFGCLSGTVTAISISLSYLTDNGWYYVIGSKKELILLNEKLEKIASSKGTIEVGNGSNQQSVGIVVAGSPLTATAGGPIQGFIGSIEKVGIYEENTLSVDFLDNLQLACEVGSTGQQCYGEVSKWDILDDEIIIWVKVPTISNAEDTVLRFYFSAGAVPNTTYMGHTGDVQAQQVWDSNYVAVYHLESDGTTIKDSTANSNNLTLSGGSIEEGIIFDGVSDYAFVDSSTLKLGDGDFSYEVLLKRTSQQSSLGIVMTGGQTGSLLSPILGIMPNSEVIQFGTDVGYIYGGTLSYDSEYVAATYDGLGQFSGLSLYVDGASISTNTQGAFSGFSNSAEYFTVAAELDDGALSKFFEGNIQEVRVSSIKRNADWIALTNKSISDNLITFIGNYVKPSLSGYENAKSMHIQIDATKIGEQLSNFPILLQINANAGINGTDLSEILTELRTPKNQEDDLLFGFIGNQKDGSSVIADFSIHNKQITNEGCTHSTQYMNKTLASVLFESSRLLIEPFDLPLFWNDMTIEWWEFRIKGVSASAILTNRVPGGEYTGMLIGYQYGSNMLCYMRSNKSASWDILSGVSMGAIDYLTWNHFAISKKGNIYRTFKNGIKISEVSSDLIPYNSTNPIKIGQDQNYFSGAIQSLRVSQKCKYVENFTPVMNSDGLVSYSRLAIEHVQTGQQCYAEIACIKEDNLDIFVNIPSISDTTDEDLLLIYGNELDENSDYVSITGEDRINSLLRSCVINDEYSNSVVWRTPIPPEMFSDIPSGKKIAFIFPHMGNDYTVQGVFIGLQASSGGASDFEPGTKVQLTFNGGDNGSLITSTNNTTDFVLFNFGELDTIVISFQQVSGSQPRNTGENGLTTYYKFTTDEVSGDDVVSGLSTTPYIMRPLHVITEPERPYQKVWDDSFLSVYHLVNSSSGAESVYDSTINKNHLTPYGSLPGKITTEDGLSFSSSSNDYINGTGDFSSIIDEYSLEVFQKWNTIPGEWDTVIRIGQANQAGAIMMGTYSTSSYWDVGVWYDHLQSSTPLNSDMQHTAITFENGDAKIIQNGVFGGTNSVALQTFTEFSTIFIGGDTQGSGTEMSDQTIKEIRISNTARSQHWLRATEYSLHDNLLLYIDHSAHESPLSGWEEHQPVTAIISANDVNTTVTDFPVMIRISQESGKNAVNLFHILNEFRSQGTFAGNVIQSYEFNSTNRLDGMFMDNLQFSSNNLFMENHAMEFFQDGSSTITLSPKLRDVLVQEDLTYCFWINPYASRNTSGSDTKKSIFGTKYSAEVAIIYHYAEYVEFYMDSDLIRTSDGSVPLHKWTFVVFVRNKEEDTVKIYLNNKVAAQGTYNYSLSYSNWPILLGDSQTDYPFVGGLSDFMIFDRALLPEEIHQIYFNRRYVTFKNVWSVSIFTAQSEFPLFLNETISSINIEATENGQYVSLCFTTDQNTYWIYSGSNWVAIASNDENIHGDVGSDAWHFKNSADVWTLSSSNEPMNTIAMALDFQENRMGYSTVNNLNQTAIHELFSSIEGVFDVAIGLKTNNDYELPEVTKVKYNNSEYWVSKVYDLAYMDGAIVSSNVSWIYRDSSDHIKVFVMITGNPNWVECTNNSPIPGITYQMNTVGKVMQFKVVFDFDTNASPDDIELAVKLI